MSSEGDFRLDEYRNQLQTKHWSSGKTGPVRKKREANINWIGQLSRENLEHNQREKQIEMVETKEGERLLIQYPGKEAIRDEDDHRPWDFRPRTLFPNGSYGPDLSFRDVWDTLFEKFEALGEEGIEPARALAALFYRMAFMVDHRRDYDVETQTRRINGADEPLSEFWGEQHPTMLRYEPPVDVVQALSEVVPELGGMSLEAFLHYNDLMAWNEDCKYYYGKTDGGETDWDWPRTGRINTLLTHISILGIITGDLNLSGVLNKFQRGRGVGPITRSEAEAITDGILGAE
ncbi:hypothetical protein [Halorussus sp. MSC15.2]|uniref:hypothetical protein n=1 Tax=Halorussus sp. MSC15.2 TaxID=2283638 RepID=UPI0013D1B1CB|nr:hypothetical protein [Halorussus sp. MSC15.2]NEU59211.1 hypothetical protein [Halorussus sp. MSC15.2]